mgnify:CR=1 FL=1|tara:strand:- start:937 stop:1329 length:393 start_codon:yes stop_codon:yes gene_type:complete
MIKAPIFPFRINDTKGFENYGSSKDVIKFHIKNLFLTNPGERISVPAYGIGIRAYLFENITQGLLNNLEDVILDQIQIYMPYIRVEDIAINDFPEENKISISLRYSILTTAEKDVITLELATTSESGPAY